MHTPPFVPTIVLFGRVSPLTKLIVDVPGSPDAQGYTVANPGADAPSLVTFNATAVAPDGMLSGANRTVPPAGSRRAPPRPIRVSITRVGPTALNSEPEPRVRCPVTSTTTSVVTWA